jgi:hypothetical protein
MWKSGGGKHRLTFGPEICYPQIVIWPFSGSQICYFPDKHNRALQGAYISGDWQPLPGSRAV